VLLNITGGRDLTLHEVNEASTVVMEAAGEDANVIFGAVIDPALDGEIVITVIATGFGGAQDVVRKMENADGRRSFMSHAQGSGFNHHPAPMTPPAPAREVEEPVLAGAGIEEAMPSFDELKRPTPWRAQTTTVRRPSRFNDHDNLDVPTFLRKQQ
jgi:cell division protein FtsZ